MRVLVFVGSFRKGSYNQGLARAIMSSGISGVEFVPTSIESLPLYNGDREAQMPQEIVQLKNEVKAADAIMFVTPEYNRSVPGGLKNAIDWISRPYGDNSFAGKPVMVTGVSTGNMGTSIAQSHLKHTMLYLDTHVMGQPEVYVGNAKERFDEQGNLTDESTKKFVIESVETFVRWAEKLSK